MFGIEKSSNRLCPSAVVKANIGPASAETFFVKSPPGKSTEAPWRFVRVDQPKSPVGWAFADQEVADRHNAKKIRITLMTVKRSLADAVPGYVVQLKGPGIRLTSYARKRTYDKQSSWVCGVNTLSSPSDGSR